MAPQEAILTFQMGEATIHLPVDIIMYENNPSHIRIVCYHYQSIWVQEANHLINQNK